MLTIQLTANGLIDSKTGRYPVHLQRLPNKWNLKTIEQNYLYQFDFIGKRSSYVKCAGHKPLVSKLGCSWRTKILCEASFVYEWHVNDDVSFNYIGQWPQIKLMIHSFGSLQPLLFIDLWCSTLWTGNEQDSWTEIRTDRRNDSNIHPS